MSTNADNRPLDADDIAAARRAWVKVALIVLAVFFLLTWQFWAAVLWVLEPRVTDWYYRTEFNSEAWKANRREGRGQRIDMADDFLRRSDLTGMTETRLKELLGEPDYTEPSTAGATRLGYRMGHDRHSIMTAVARLVVEVHDGKAVRAWRYSN